MSSKKHLFAFEGYRRLHPKVVGRRDLVKCLILSPVMLTIFSFRGLQDF